MGWLAIHRSDPQHIPVLPTRFSPADRRGTLISGGRGHPFAWPPAKDQCPDLLRDRAATRGPRTVGLWARRSVGRSPWSITASRSWGSPSGSTGRLGRSGRWSPRSRRGGTVFCRCCSGRGSSGRGRSWSPCGGSPGASSARGCRSAGGRVHRREGARGRPAAPRPRQVLRPRSRGRGAQLLARFRGTATVSPSPRRGTRGSSEE